MPISVHIIDSSKPSLVMTSEVFKDKIPGSVVSFSLTGKDGLAHLIAKDPNQLPDALVVDFNLPDADGVTLIKELRKFYRGPIFMTAHPDKIVEQAVQEELFHYHDACCWVPKPVRFEILEKRIEQFVVNRHRLGKRFDVNFLTLMIGKGEGRGKRAPKFSGRALNISMGGLCVAFNEPAKLKRDDEFIITLGVPAGAIEGSSSLSVLKPLINTKISSTNKSASNLPGKVTPANGRTKHADSFKKTGKAAPQKGSTVIPTESLKEISVITPPKIEEYKLRATVAWSANGGKKIGLQFAKIPETQRRQIEVFLKGLCA